MPSKKSAKENVVSRSWTSRASLLQIDNGEERLLLPLPNPTLRGDGDKALDKESTKDELTQQQFANAIDNLVDSFDAKHTDCVAGDDLDWLQIPVADLDNVIVHVSIYTTGSQCRTCGRRENAPSDWCHDVNGCESFRNATPKTKRGKLHKSAIAGKFGK